MFELLGPPLRHRARARATGAATYRGRRRGSRAGRAWLALGGVAALALGLGAGSAAASPASADNPQVAVDAAGDAVAVWDFYDGATWIVQAATRPAGGAWHAPVDVSAPGPDAGRAQVAIGPSGDAIAVWRRFDGANRIVQAAARPAGGAWHAPVDLSAPGRNADYARVAVGAGGLAYAVWVSDNADGTSVVQAAARSGGGAWRAPVDLSSPGRVYEDPPEVAVDAAGDAVAVWGWRAQSGTGNEVVQAAARSALAVTRFWQAPVTLSAPGHYGDFPRVAMNPAGVAYAVWRDVNTGIVQASARAGGGAWQPPVNLSTPDRDAYDPQVAINGAGDAVAVWEGGSLNPADYPHEIVQAAARSGHAVTRFWQAPVNLSAPGSTQGPQVSLDAAGNAVAVWDDYDLPASNLVVRAATRPAATGAWQVPVTLSAADRNDAFFPHVALDAAGDAVAVWQCDGLTFPGAARAAAGAAASGVWQAPVDLSAPGCVATGSVPDVVGSSKRSAAAEVSAAGLIARFTGATTAATSYVATETPAPNRRIPAGSTVTMSLKQGSAF